MLYLLTNPYTTQLGIYEISIKQIAFQLGYSIESVMALIDRFDNKYGIIIYSKSTGEIAIKNFLRHSIVKGGKPVEDCLKKELQEVKNKSLISAVFQHISKFDNLKETVKKIINEYEIENDNDNERIVHESSTNRQELYFEIIHHLNEKADKKYRANNKATQKHINARLKEGYTVEDFKSVIDKKCAEWKNTEMEQYLRPETLFGTKFEGYLNSKVNKKGSEKVDTGNKDNETNQYSKWVTGGTVL